MFKEVHIDTVVSRLNLLLHKSASQLLFPRVSGKLGNALDLHVGTEREGCDTDASASRRVRGEILANIVHGQSCPHIESPSAHLKLNLVHRCEVAREVCKENVALQNGLAGNTSTLEDLSHVLDGDAL